MSELVGLTPPEPGEIDHWQERRQEKANQLRRETMIKIWQEKDWTERNAKVSQSMKGNTNGSHTKGIKKGPMPEERKQKISAANKGRVFLKHITTETIIELYNAGIGITAIGKKLGIDKGTVKKRLLSVGIEIVRKAPR
jgi:hypothetical protein